MGFIILSILALYLYSGFMVSYSDHQKYKILLQFEKDDVMMSEEEIEVLDDLYQIGGINSVDYKLNFFIYMWAWFPLFIYNLFLSIKYYLTSYFFVWYQVKLFKLKLNVSFYRLNAKPQVKISFVEGQCYIDLYFMGIGVWKEK